MKGGRKGLGSEEGGKEGGMEIARNQVEPKIQRKTWENTDEKRPSDSDEENVRKGE